jgi:hypothetical protein
MGRATLLYNGHVEVRLTEEEQKEASRKAWQRHYSHRDKGRLDTKTRAGDDGRLLDLRGALAEQAVAVALGVPWDGKFKPIAEWQQFWRREGHDVSGIEVKSTKRRDNCLILHKHSSPKLPAVLAIIESKSLVTLVGWRFTHEGQKEEYWRTDIPVACYMVPQSDLQPMAALCRLLGIEPPPKEPEITSEELEEILSRPTV